jgi:two-component system phosphate regulon sensor histidine kinase PhoR
MLARLFSLSMFELLGGLLGWFFHAAQDPWRGALIGCVAAGLLWFLLDMSRALRVLHWLRRGDVSEVALRRGLWGEVSERARRLVRAREQQVRESDARLQDFLAALQASPNGVVLLDAQGGIEWCNQTASGHFGLDATRDVQQHFVNLVRDPSFAAYYAAGDFQHDVTVPGRGNTPSHPVRLSVQLHPYGDGRRLLLSRDVTALEQAEAMRRDFVANVSHEIRTPLTVLSGFVETLQTLPLQEAERARYLDLMAQQAQRMQALVGDLLMLSRLEGSPLPGTGEWLALESLTRQLEQEARALSAAADPAAGPVHLLQFDSSVAGQISGVPSELHSALSNLVSNAIRYTLPGGVIEAGWRVQTDGGVEFFVQDSGPGIAPEHLPRLTERFYRVDRSRSRDTGGTGLGLAIVKHVAQRHGAELRIESTPGKGSRFSMVFAATRVRR